MPEKPAWAPFHVAFMMHAASVLPMTRHEIHPPDEIQLTEKGLSAIISCDLASFLLYSPEELLVVMLV